MGMDMMARDFDQLCLNTQKYNEDGSLIHEDSIVLQSVFTNAREKLQAEWKDDDKESSHAPSVASNKMEEGDSEDVSLASTPKPPKKKKKEKERKRKKKHSSDEEEDEDY